MQFSEIWLREYVNPVISSEQLGHALTMAGLEVEAMEAVAPAFSHVVVAEVLTAEKHPDADRLQVLTVDVGSGTPLQIVCGASNARVGLKAPCAMVGAALPGFNIKQAKVRGVESFGMMCSAKELGLAEESSGLLELPADAVTGSDIRDYLQLDDQLFTLKLTPNRSDCLSIVGIARDVAAITGAALQSPAIEQVKAVASSDTRVVVREAAACPYYSGRSIRRVNAAAATPVWMQRRLERSGIRSISAIVDITNYVLLESGQPLHAFDAAKLQDGLEVRYAGQGETLALLNQQQATLQQDMLVIADAQGPVALAGIMGGQDSAVSLDTQDIFLESAYFIPGVIAGKARRLGLSTDSSYRFERGVDFGHTRQALERATALILEICGGEPGEIVEVQGTLPVRKPVTLRYERLLSVLGIPLAREEVSAIFARLGFKTSELDGRYEITPPSYRFDIEIEEDLIEEVARLHGYEHIPAIAPQASLAMLPASGSELNRAWVRDAMVAGGYQEIVSYSFVDESWERDLLGNPDAIVLKNPIASNMSVMRSGLWGGLLQTLVYNLNRKQPRARLFEIGSAYHKVDSGYAETMRVSGLAYGPAHPEQWAQEERDVDFYDVKAQVDTLTHGRAVYQAATHPALHPGQSARIVLDGKVIGWLGKLHPKWQQHYQLPRSTVVFECDLAPLLAVQVPRYQEVAKFPPVRRDIAVVVDETTPVQALLDTMNEAKNALVSEVALFDIYRGKGVPESKKSLAFLVLMQDTQKTLTDAEADAVMSNLLALLKTKHGAELRN
jgi:phenylalanyl-tRNA synthetase beta chain